MATATFRQDGKVLTRTFTPPTALDTLMEELGLRVPHPCGGRGRCGKCAVAVSGAVSEPTAEELAAGTRLSCQITLLGDCTVTMPGSAGMEQIQLSGAVTGTAPMDGNFGAAVDIGTTTLALALYDLHSGALLSQQTAVNPQVAVAADVIGRIHAAMDGRQEALQVMILDAIAGLLEQACMEASLDESKVDLLILTGNTTMLYLLTGRDPASLSRAPFEADTLFGVETTILGRRAVLPPCMNAFVGADITCAVLASGMCRQEETSLLCDVGTNGELALWKGGRLFVTSTAAGPAFEGAGIRHGCGSIHGAVDRAWVQDGKLRLHTIGDGPVSGICGSGLIDLVAAGLELGCIDETGAMDDPMELGNGITLEPQDIRAVQVAKAAIAAGIATMLSQADIGPEEINRLYIAGGFGSHLGMAGAAAIGLFPEALSTRAVVLGNAALTGASRMLLDRNLSPEATAIADHSTHVNLGGNPEFNYLYVENMLFPEEDI